MPKTGYKSPPVRHQFKPGQSGNPKGRPKKRPKARDVVEEVLMRPITVNKNGRRVRMPLLQAVFEGLSLKAVVGDPKAVREFINVAKTMGLLNEPAEQDVQGGVIVLPGIAASDEEWEERWKDARQLRLEDVYNNDGTLKDPEKGQP